MTEGKPIPRIGVDWNDDLFICYDARPGDALNNLHNGLSTDPAATSLHWSGVHTYGLLSPTTVEFRQVQSNYGIRVLYCTTGADPDAGCYFGYDGVSSTVSDFHLDSIQAYTAVMWIRAVNPGGIGTPMVMDIWKGTSTFLAHTTFTITDEWQQVSVTFTPASAPITAGFLIHKSSDATDMDFQATGFMIVEGSTAPSGFNTGTSTDLYDNISQHVTAFDTQIGRDKWTNSLPSEGIAHIHLNNESRRYSPEYSGSPLYGSMLARLLLTVDVQHTSIGSYAWERLYAGWISEYTPTYGKNRNHQAVITAEQGMFRLNNMPFRANVSGDTTADVLIRQIIKSGFMSAATPYQVLLNRARLGASYFVDESTIMSLETGVSTLSPTGEDWNGDNTPAAKALRDIMDVEEGFFWISRTGVIYFFNRFHFTTTIPSLAVNAGAAPVTNASYSYGKYYYNQVKVDYKPPSNRVGVIWQTRDAVKVRYTRPGHISTVPVKFEYEEGKKMTVSAVNPFDGSTDASTFTAVTAGGADRSSQISVTFSALENGQGKIYIKNTRREIVFVSVTLRGTIVETYGGQTVEVVSEDEIRGGVAELKRSPKIIHEEDEALNLASHLLSVYQEPFGLFENITLKNKDDIALEYVLGLPIGTYISLNEYQTGHTGDYVIIGERYDWKPGELTVKYSLYPQFRAGDYWICGESTIGVDTYAGY